MTFCNYDDNDSLLPSLKQIIKEYHLSADKSLGQNFLLDMNLLRKIARVACAGQHDVFIEIGAGPGGLTRALLAEGAKKVIAIEADARCIPILQQIQSIYPNRLDIIYGDALKVNFNDLCETPYRIATNLPYNISSEFITRLLTNTEIPKKWLSATMMLQKEFAVRCQESENSKEYGRLSVLCNLTCDFEILFDVHPSNFTPQPKIMSCIAHIIPNNKPLECDLKKLEKVTRATFSQRRKMLRTSLKQITDNPQELCNKAGISIENRADHLSPKDYLKLAQMI